MDIDRMPQQEGKNENLEKIQFKTPGDARGPPATPIIVRNAHCLSSRLYWGKPSPLDIEVLFEELLHQLSYAIKNKLKPPKTPW